MKFDESGIDLILVPKCSLNFYLILITQSPFLTSYHIHFLCFGLYFVNHRSWQAENKGYRPTEAGRGHATLRMPVQRAKCWRLLKIEPNAWAGGKAAVQSALTFKLYHVGALEFFGKLYSLAKGFGTFLRGFGQALEKGRVLFFVTASISLSVQALWELHALSPPPAGRYALAENL